MKVLSTKKLTKIFGAAVLAVAVTGCENSADVARKPKLVDLILDQSMQSCPTEQISNYKNHLSKALYDTWSEDLDFVIANNVTICLDGRLDEDKLNIGFFNDTPISLLYTSDQPILTLAYNDGEVTEYAGDMLDELRDEYEDQPQKLKNGPDQYGYTVFIKTRSYHYKDAVDQGGYQKNPQIHKPPMKKLAL